MDPSGTNRCGRPSATCFRAGCRGQSGTTLVELAVAITLAIFTLSELYRRDGKRGHLVPVVLLALTLGGIQLICSVIVTAVSMAMVLCRAALARKLPGRDFEAFLAVALGSLPPASYYLWSAATNPAFRTYLAQSRTSSPPPQAWLLGLGIILPLALWNICSNRRCCLTSGGLLLAVWPAVVALLLYIPHFPQRRFAQGVMVPLACLAAPALDGLFQRRSSWSRIILAVATLSNVSFIAMQTRICMHSPEPIFHPRQQLEAIEWLKENTDPRDTILAGPRTGAFIPAAIGHRVFWIHWCETFDLPQKRTEFDAFFDADTQDAWRCRFLTKYSIKYLFYGPQERSWGNFQPQNKPYLRLSFQRGEYAIYEVQTALCKGAATEPEDAQTSHTGQTHSGLAGKVRRRL